MPLAPRLRSVYHMNSGAWPLREPMMVVSFELRYSIERAKRSTCFLRVTMTPQGIGQPRNLWPDTAIESIGSWKETSGPNLTKGSMSAKSAPSQWM